MNISTESFYCIICISTIEHIGLPAYNIKPFKDGDKEVIKKIYDILKTGGKLIFTVPFGEGMVNRFERTYNFDSLKKLLKDFQI